MDVLAYWPLSIILGFSFLFGMFIGSFLNVLSDRLPREETILGRSYCEKCQHILSSKDLIPVLSFVFLRGRCRYCKTKLSFYYPLAEIITGLIVALTSYLFITFVSNTNIALFLVYQTIVACFIVIVLADLKFHIIPDEMQIALLIVSVVKIFIMGISWQIIGIYFFSGFVVMLPILLLFLFTQGRGMGFGDVKYAFIMGLLLGWQQGLLALYIGFVTGAAVGTVLIVSQKKKMKSKIAFGPFLVLGTYIMLLYGERIVEQVKLWYGV